MVGYIIQPDRHNEHLPKPGFELTNVKSVVLTLHTKRTPVYIHVFNHVCLNNGPVN